MKNLFATMFLGMCLFASTSVLAQNVPATFTVPAYHLGEDCDIEVCVNYLVTCDYEMPSCPNIPDIAIGWTMNPDGSYSKVVSECHTFSDASIDQTHTFNEIMCADICEYSVLSVTVTNLGSGQSATFSSNGPWPYSDCLSGKRIRFQGSDISLEVIPGIGE